MRISEPTAERGGKSKRFYTITKEGFEALDELKDLQTRVWTGLPKPVSK
jgi:hypothetical protein